MGMKLLAIIAAAVLSAGLSSSMQRMNTQDTQEVTEMSSRGFSMHSNDSAGNGSTLVDDGNGCMIMSTPSGSISTGC